ncbi:MAG TPA: DUF2249 domain-containing protein [Rhodospirillaceae bacterium]|nr:DUF2249 domain-containing protein [Rhodospirillaceae bacterium]
MTDAIAIDVRPLLAQGTDPLQTVLERTASLAAGGVLVLDAPFDPLPLRRLLAGKGFSSEARRLGDGHWQVTCRRDGKGQLAGDPPPAGEACPGPGDLDGPVERRADGLHIDLRGMAPPKPLVAVLRLLSSLEGDAGVVARFDRDPVYLYPELAEIGWTVEQRTDEPSSVTLRLCRDGGAR